MRILFISDYYPSTNRPQFCIYIQQQAQALTQLGHLVEVIVPIRTSHFKVKHDSMLLAGIKVYYLEYSTLYKGTFFYPLFLKNVSNFEKVIDFNQYDILSIHMFQEDTLRIFLKIAKKYKRRVVIHYHGLSVLYDQPLPLLVRALQARGNLFLKRLIRKADAIVGVSDKVVERIHAIYPVKLTFTVYNGVDTGLFLPRLKKEDNLFKIITVASLKKIKGNHYLIEAVKMLTDQHPDQKFKLFIIGTGPEEEHLKELTLKQGLNEVVSFYGYIRYEEVAKILRTCDVYAMPSYYEALGCAYLEAMACRLPVIGCRNQGIDEIIHDGYNGILIEPHDVKQLYEKLNFLFEHSDFAENIGYMGYQTVISNYTWKHSAKSLLAVYENVKSNE